MENKIKHKAQFINKIGYIFPEIVSEEITKKEKLNNLNILKHSTNEVMDILRRYRDHAWVNGATRHELEEWMVKEFELDRGEHFSKNK